MSSEVPFVSIVIPCLNEEEHIEACLESVLRQRYPRHRMEIVLADGGSTDSTLARVARTAARHPLVAFVVVPNPDRIQSAGCNCAIRRARGDVIVRMDAHAEYHPEFVARSVEALASTGAANVGGAARPVARSRFQKALATALKSPVAMGGASYWRAGASGYVDTVWNGAFPRYTFERVGLYDPKAHTNEDAELNLRITRAGMKVYLARDLIAWYYPRRSLPALARQYFRYGKGRARTVLKHRALQSYRPLAPWLLTTVMFATCVSLLVASPSAPVLAGLLAVYLSVVVLEAMRLGAREGLSLTPLLAVILPSMHIAHGLGFWTGLVRYGLRPDWPRSDATGRARAVRAGGA